MASAATASSSSDTAVIMSGYLTKQGGSYRNWKKRYFSLKGTNLSYYKTKDDASPKGEIDLKTGRGVRNKKHCSSELDWPQEAKAALSFGLATKSRTYYLYGSDKAEIQRWMIEIQNVIKEHGKPTHEWKKDSEGKPEGAASKLVKKASKVTIKVSKMVAKETGVVDDGVIDAVAEAAENQADADPNASITDRVKMAAGDTAGVVGEAVDNEYVSAATEVVKEQAEADDDTTLGQRVGMAAGTTLQATSEMVDNDVGAAVLNTTGGVVHDQAEADPDTSIQQRAAIAVGSTAGGVGEAMEGDDIASAVASAVEKGAEATIELLEEQEDDSDSKEEESKEEES